MSWDESLFRVALRTFEKLLGADKKSPEQLNSMALADVQSSLSVLAAALTGGVMELSEAEAFGGFSGDRLLLPARMDLSSERELNGRAYLLRVAYACASRRLGYTLPPDAGDDSQAQLLLTLLAVPSTLRLLEEDLPSCAEIRAHFAVSLEPSLDLARLGVSPHEAMLIRSPEELWALGNSLRKNLPNSWLEPAQHSTALKLWGMLLAPGKTKSQGAIARPSEEEISADALPSGTEFKAKPRENVTLVDLGENKLDENPLVHAFEKVKTAEEYQGGKKQQDGSDELTEHLEALEELDLRHVIRSRERTRSLYKADAMLDGAAPDLIATGEEDEPQARCFQYDEWDSSKRAYRKEWCSVFASVAPSRGDPGVAEGRVQEAIHRHRRQIRELKGTLSRLLTERAWVSRQTDGPEIDLDAVVDRYVAVQSGHTPSEKIYLARRRRERDFAALILLDLSYSTDSWVAGHRVLDVARDSVVVLGEVLGDLSGQLAVAGFYSNTRRDCRYQILKGFEESWEGCRSRIGSIEPTGYTRIGPALRHSIALLSKVPSKKKLLLLVSDGKPTDYDRYEGRYGIDDIRQTIREATRSAIQVRALAIDAQAKFYLPRMFGTGNYRILPRPDCLPEHLTQIFMEAMR